MEPDFSKLSAKPSWWMLRYLKIAAILFLVLSAVSFVGSVLFGFIDSIALNDPVNEEDSISLNLSYMFDELAWASIGLGFYAAVLWFLSQIMEKVDQIVWLNASNEDRMWIYNRRVKKKSNVKNQ